MTTNGSYAGTRFFRRSARMRARRDDPGPRPVAGRSSSALAAWFIVMGTIMADSTTRAEPARESSWDVSIAVPESGGERTISLAPDFHFHVVLRNVSGREARLWKDSNSWGYEALRFEVTGPNGRAFTIRKKARDWRKNIPSFWLVGNGETVVYDVFLAGGDWEGLPKKLDGTRVEMRAVVEVEADEKSRELGVWTGRAASEAGGYVLR